ncbi:MAG: MOSC domain-containing protein, partial [Gammaproteobacteria bacterium]
QTLKLLDEHRHSFGELVWIGIRPSKFAPLKTVRQLPADCDTGLADDHYAGSNRQRQVTLFQWEYLEVLSAWLGTQVTPELVRRNLQIKGINLLSLKQRRIRIGQVELYITGLCHPCTRMEKNLGPGGYQAMRGHGGLTAQIVTGGILHLGDRLTVLPKVSEDGSG